MSTKKKVWWWIGGAVIVLYALFPIAWIISISLKAPSDIANGQFTPTNVSWENYETILTGMRVTSSCRRCGTPSASA